MVLQSVNPLNAELNPICHLRALLGTHHILHISKLRVSHAIEGISLHAVVMKVETVSC